MTNFPPFDAPPSGMVYYKGEMVARGDLERLRTWDAYKTAQEAYTKNPTEDNANRCMAIQERLLLLGGGNGDQATPAAASIAVESPPLVAQPSPPLPLVPPTLPPFLPDEIPAPTVDEIALDLQRQNERERWMRGRPIIICNNQELRVVRNQTINALQRWNIPPKLFTRSGMLTRITSGETGPIISQMNDAMVRGCMTECALYAEAHRSSKSNEEVHTLIFPPIAVAREVLHRDDLPFPPLTGLVEIPIIHEDGSIRTEAGYDSATRLYYHPTMDPLHPERSLLRTIPPLPDTLEEDMVFQIREALLDLLCDFPFVDEASRTNAIACLITPIVRPLINGPIPMAILDKPQAGVGASLLSEVISIIATGRPAAMMTCPKVEEEWEKRIGAMVMDGTPVITVDNIEGTFFSANLASVLTSITWKTRILGMSKMPVMDHRAVWIGNGNNVRLGGDLPRRCYWSKMDAKLARPWQRTEFRIQNIRAYAEEYRGAFIASILMVAREWIRKGKPVPRSPKLGGYEQWCMIVGGILEILDINGFLGNLEQMYEEVDRDIPQWEAFLMAWMEIWPQPVTVSTVVNRLIVDKESTTPSSYDPINLWELLPDEIAVKSDRSLQRVLGRKLSQRKDQVFPCGVVIRAVGTERHAIKWHVGSVS